MFGFLVWFSTGAPCLVVSWVAGSYLLTLGRPESPADVLRMLTALAVAVYGVAIAFAPVCTDAAPLAATLGWRIALAAAAVQLYDHLLGWCSLAKHLTGAAASLRSWFTHYIELGRAAAQHGKGAE